MSTTSRRSSSPTHSSSHDDEEDDERLSIVQPLGYSLSTCGYCSPKGQRSTTKSSRSYGCWGHALSAETYKALIDRGWRRSGCYLYKPDNGRTCCPQYTISLDAAAFQPSRSQRQVLQRFNAFVRDGEREGQPGWGPVASGSGTAKEEGEDAAMQPAKGGKKDKGKGKANQAQGDWTELVHAAEWDKSTEEKPFKHRFECIVEPASFTEEKYKLYRRYQMEVHGDSASKVTPGGFRRFLVDSPLEIEPTRALGLSYGSHHVLYRLDGRLVALAVLDLLPRAVSSVYFIWDPDYAGLSLGKLSALRETAMVREMQARGAWTGEGRYMMGFYIHSCPKMRYKADYQPSFLLDPETNVYYPWSTCKPLLDAASSGVASFSRPASSSSSSTPPAAATSPPAASAPVSANAAAGNRSLSDEEDEEEDDDDDVAFPSPPPLGCLDPHQLPKDLLLGSFVIEQRTLMPLLLSTAWHDPALQQETRELLAATGDAAKGKMAIWTGR
ncbi:hypothetical protein JCM10207_007596 [Rhodosporidiobolus poonsookiae]